MLVTGCNHKGHGHTYFINKNRLYTHTCKHTHIHIHIHAHAQHTNTNMTHIQPHRQTTYNTRHITIILTHVYVCV